MNTKTMPLVVLSVGGILMFCASLPVLAADDSQDEGWVSLFDGETLDGWTVKCKPADAEKKYWSVDKGTILCDSMNDGKHDYVWLTTDKEYGDFELRLKVQGFGDSSGNSGVQIRSRYDDSIGWLDGPQVDIHPPVATRTGSIYDETRETRRWLFHAKPDNPPRERVFYYGDAADGPTWNEMRIVCRGTKIKSYLNGVLVADYDGAGLLDDDAHRTHRVGMKGHVALQLHRNDRLRIRFKDIEIRPLETK